MKNILFIEDDTNKIKQITEFLETIKNDLVEFAIEIKKSYQSGLNAIIENHYDLILLDMSMHNFDKTVSETGGEFMQFAGEDILKEMSWNDINIKTIIVTQYDIIGNKTLIELKKYWLEEFGDIYRGTVFYSVNESNWKNELFNFIKKELE